MYASWTPLENTWIKFGFRQACERLRVASPVDPSSSTIKSDIHANKQHGLLDNTLRYLGVYFPYFYCKHWSQYELRPVLLLHTITWNVNFRHAFFGTKRVWFLSPRCKIANNCNVIAEVHCIRWRFDKTGQNVGTQFYVTLQTCIYVPYLVFAKGPP